jgi:hypothetical protein
MTPDIFACGVRETDASAPLGIPAHFCSRLHRTT